MRKLQADEHRRISGLRAHLDGYAARQAAKCAARNPDGCRGLRDILTRLSAALRTRDYAAFEQADFDLHTAIIRLAAVPCLYESWLPVWRGLHELHSSSFEECWPDLRVLVREHAHLVEDICRGDPNVAEQTARSHVQAVWHRYDQLSQNPDNSDPLERATAAIAFRLGTPISLREIAGETAFVLEDSKPYFGKVTQYIHLNPVRVKAHEDKSLDDRHDIALRNPGSSYGQIMGMRRCPSWLDRQAVLNGWGKSLSEKRKNYRKSSCGEKATGDARPGRSFSICRPSNI